MGDDGQAKKSSGDTVVTVAVMVIVALCLLAVLGGVKYQAKLKARSQNRSVTGNLRMLVQGAEQYFVSTGRSSVASAALVGTNSSQYVKAFTPLAGETYTATILQATAITASGIAGARTITLAP